MDTTKPLITCSIALYFVLLTVTILDCSSANGHREHDELVVLTYLEVISQDTLRERGEDNITFCLAKDVDTQTLVDPDQAIIARVGSNEADVVGLSECNVEWLIKGRGERKDLNALDVLLWIRDIVISGENATVTIVRSGRYGHREQLFCDLARSQKGWAVVSLREGVIE